MLDEGSPIWEAADLVPIYTRGEVEEDGIVFQPGCFNCDHTVKPMAVEKHYVTYVMTHDDIGISFTISTDDTFWSEIDNTHFLKTTLQSPGRMFRPHISTLLSEERLDPYVRLYLDADGIVQHTNARYNVENWLACLNLDAGIRITLSCDKLSDFYGIYYLPRLRHLVKPTVSWSQLREYVRIDPAAFPELKGLVSQFQWNYKLEDDFPYSVETLVPNTERMIRVQR